MKTISKILALLIIIVPISLFGHDGHVHTGTFWENSFHFMFTNGYLFLTSAVAGYLFFKHLKTRQKVRNSVKYGNCPYPKTSSK